MIHLEDRRVIAQAVEEAYTARAMLRPGRNSLISNNNYQTFLTPAGSTTASGGMRAKNVSSSVQPRVENSSR